MSHLDKFPLFNRCQKKIVAAAITSIALFILIAFIIFCFIVLRNMVDNFKAILWPLAIAFLLTMLLRPFVTFVEKYTRLSRTQSIMVLYVATLLGLSLLGSIILPILFEQAIELISFIPDLSHKLWDFIQEHSPNLIEALQKHFSSIDRYGDQLTQALKSILSFSFPAIKEITTRFMNIIQFITGLAIIPIYLFYLLESKRDLKNDFRTQFSFIPEEWQKDILFLTSEFSNILIAFFRGQMLIGLILGIFFSIGFSIIGLQFSLVLGLCIGLLNIIPYLGTIIGLLVTLPLAYFQPEGSLSTVSFTFIIFIIIHLIESYLLTPKIMKKQTGLHPMIVIIAIFFWGTAFSSLLGMLLAIPLTAFLVIAWRLLKKKYIP